MVYWCRFYPERYIQSLHQENKVAPEMYLVQWYFISVWEVGIGWHGLLKSEDIKRLQKQDFVEKETCFVLFNDVCWPENKI